MNRLSSTRRARSRWVRAVGVTFAVGAVGAGIASAALIPIKNGDFTAPGPINYAYGFGCYPCVEGAPAGSNTTVTRVDTQPGGAAEVTTGTAAINLPSNAFFSINTADDPTLRTVAGESYRASMSIRSTAAATVLGNSVNKPAFIRIREWDTNGTPTLADDTLVSEYATEITLTDTATPYSVTSTAAAPGDRLDINIGQSAPAAGNSFTVDDITLESGVAPPPGAPKASFTYAPKPVRPGGTITLTNTSMGADTVLWDLNNDNVYGDPLTPLGPLAAGTYVVKLQAIKGTVNTVSKQTIVVAPNILPSAKITIAPGALTAGQVVTFNDASTDSDGTVGGRTWDLNNDGVFGDFLNSPTATAIFGAGNYKVGLKVTDNEGGTSTATIDFTIAPGGATTPGTVTPVPPGTIAKKPVVKKKFRKAIVCKVVRNKKGQIVKLKNGKPKKVCKVVWVKIVPKKK